MPEVKVTASYDGAGLDKGLNNLQKELAQTAVSAGKLDSALSKGVVKGANQGAAALTDFNRIIQDSPFGIIGITNNITQLQESFSRLRATTGSTGGAMKALLGQLTGAGGVGLAISLITTAVTFASMGFGAWTRGMQQNREEAKKTADAYGEVVKELSKELVQVQLVVTALKNENLSRSQRIEAIRQLQQISPAYFGTLNTEKATVEQITAAYDKFSQSIIRNISAKLKEKALLDVTEKILKLEEKGRDIGRTQVVQNGKLVTIQNAQLVNQDQLNKSGNQYQQFMKGTIGLTQQQADELENLRITKKKLLDDIAASRGADPFIKLGKVVKAKVDTVELEPIRYKVTKEANVPLDLPGTGTLQSITVPVLPKLVIKPINDNEYRKALRAIELNEGIQRIGQELETTIAQGLGNALTQGLNGANIGNIFGGFFKTVLSTLGSAIQELGIQTLAAGKLIIAVKKLFGTSAGIGASIALIALGGVIKALANSINIQGFATGGTSPGGAILVGERGPEVITPPRGSVITPNAQTNAMLGGGGMWGDVIFRIGDRELVGVLKKGNERLGRNGQL